MLQPRDAASALPTTGIYIIAQHCSYGILCTIRTSSGQYVLTLAHVVLAYSVYILYLGQIEYSSGRQCQEKTHVAKALDMELDELCVTFYGSF